MALVAIINSTTHRPGVNHIGDIVGIFDDSHQFSDAEQNMFDLIQVPNLTRSELISVLKSPEIRKAIDTDGVERTVWRNSNTDPWRELVTAVKYTWTTGGLPEQFQAALTSETVDRDTKLNMLTRLGNNTSWQEVNQTVVDVAEIVH